MLTVIGLWQLSYRIDLLAQISDGFLGIGYADQQVDFDEEIM